MHDLIRNMLCYVTHAIITGNRLHYENDDIKATIMCCIDEPPPYSSQQLLAPADAYSTTKTISV